MAITEITITLTSDAFPDFDRDELENAIERVVTMAYPAVKVTVRSIREDYTRKPIEIRCDDTEHCGCTRLDHEDDIETVDGLIRDAAETLI